MSILYRRTDDGQRNEEISSDNPLPVRNEAGEFHIGEVGGRTRIVSTAFSRSATDTTQYSAGDVVGPVTAAPLSFSGSGRIGNGTGMIIRATIIHSANQATKPTYELYLFDERPSSVADNSAWAPTDGELEACIGVIDTWTWKVGTSTAGAAGNSVATATGLNIPYQSGPCTCLWGILVERGTYTPVAGERIKVRLSLAQD